MKHCIDCHHCYIPRTYYPHQFGIGIDHHYDDARCQLTDVVFGSGRAGDPCSSERSIGACGAEAARFVPKPPPPPPERSLKPSAKWWQLGWWRA